VFAPTPIREGSPDVDYALLKLVHVACAALSYAGFFVRGVWMMRDSAMLERPWVKILPHANDTLLLASAIALAAMSRQYPFVHGWLTAKVLALVLYIVLGMAALRAGRPKPLRIAAWVAAQAVFLYIVWVAMARNPSPWTG
jgi:uncharacterized membrane protein SirB2